MYGPSNVWTLHTSKGKGQGLRCMDPSMVADVGAFEVADVPTYSYVYTLPISTLLLTSFSVINTLEETSWATFWSRSQV